MYMNTPPQEILDEFVFPNDTVRFSLHTQFKDWEFASILSKYKQLPSIEVSPTSSTRTVLVKGKPYAIKLHSPKKLGNFYRTIGEKTIKHAIRVSEILKEGRFDGFGFLPEIIGMAFPAKEGKRSW